MPFDFERGDDCEPDRTATEHERALALLDARLVHRVQTNRHRLGERGATGVETVRHLEAHARSESHAVGVRTVVVVREPDRLEPGRARERERHRHDQVADGHRDAVRLRPELDDLRRELVSHDEVGVRIELAVAATELGDDEQAVGVMQRVEIGTADPARLHLDQRVTRSGNGLRHIFDDHLPASGYRCTHGAILGPLDRPVKRRGHSQR